MTSAETYPILTRPSRPGDIRPVTPQVMPLRFGGTCAHCGIQIPARTVACYWSTGIGPRWKPMVAHQGCVDQGIDPAELDRHILADPTEGLEVVE